MKPEHVPWLKREWAWLDEIPAPRTLALVCGLALAVRLGVSLVSHGSNDIDTWQWFANLVSSHGVVRTYELDPRFNHPPLTGWYAVFAAACAHAARAQFDFVFKLLPILASTATVFMVQRLGKLKVIWLLLFAVNPTDVLISAYHGNTDSLCSACCVASVLFADRERPWLAGLLLGAAINVKLIPVVLIAPLALSLPRRHMWRFGVSLALCALPFLFVALGSWAAFHRNALAYNSQPAPWGEGVVFSALDGPMNSLSSLLRALGLSLAKPLIFGSSVVLGLLQRRTRMFSRAQLCAIALSCFLVFAPGFGVQYLVYPSAFFAVSVAQGGFRYTYLAGTFAFLLYYGCWTGTWPAFSFFKLPFGTRSVAIGFLVWVWLTHYYVVAARRALSSLLLRPTSSGP